MRKVIKWWKRQTKHKFINGGKGVISIFMAALMLPFLSMADYLVELERYHQATTILDEVMDSANLSTLSNYDEYIQERFGLISVSQNTDINSIFNVYLNANLDTYNTWSNVTAYASGAYPLSDTSILMNQILELSKYTVPTAMAGEFVLSEIISTLEKFKGVDKISSLVSKTAGAADKAVILTENAADLVSETNKLKTNVDTYTVRFANFKTAINEYAGALAEVNSKQNTVNNLNSQLSAVNSDIDDLEGEIDALDAKLANEEITQAEYNSQAGPVNSELAGKKSSASGLNAQLTSASSELSSAQAVASQKKTAYESAQSEYSQSIAFLKDSLMSYQTAADKVVASTVSMKESLADVGEATKVYIDFNTKDSLEKDKKKIKDLIEAEEKKEADERDEKQLAEWKKAESSLETQITEVEAENRNVSKIVESVNDGGKAYADSLANAMSGYDSAVITSCAGVLDTIKSRVDNLTSQGITASTVISDADYFVSIPALINASVIETILQQAEDDAKTSGIVDMINAFGTTFRNMFTSAGIYDSRLDAYLSGTAPYTPGIIDAILTDISQLIGYLEMASDGLVGFVKIIAHLKDILTTIGNLLAHIGIYLAEMVTRTLTAISELLSNQIGEKFLLDSYLTYTLSNRTDMEADSTMGGENPLTDYSFSDVKFATCEPGNSIPVAGNITALITLLSDVANGGDDLMFCGAELEYIFVGSRSELINQTVVFFDLYFLRLLLDIAPIMTNMEVQDMATLAGSPTLGIGSVVVYVLEILIEPFIDTLLIVNGKDISLIKKVVYLTPTGIPVLFTRFVDMELDEAATDEITAASSKLLKTTAYISSAKKDDEGITWNYENYLFVFMLIMGDNETYLQRLQNIISLETNAYYGADSFDIGRAYTYINADTTASYNTILPLDNLSNLKLLQITRNRSRGY